MIFFYCVLSHTLAAEGYYTGSGPTYRGIDRRWWPEWTGWLVVDDWRAGIITAEQRDEALAGPVVDFYRVNFWHLIRGDELAALDLPLALAMFLATGDRPPNPSSPAARRRVASPQSRRTVSPCATLPCSTLGSTIPTASQAPTSDHPAATAEQAAARADPGRSRRRAGPRTREETGRPLQQCR